MKMLAVVGAALAIVAIAAPARADEKAAKITGYDSVARPGETAKLRARLEKIGYLGVNPSVEGELLDFFLLPADEKSEAQPKFLGSGKTDGSGYAEIDFPTKDPGLFEIEARIRKGAPYVGVPAPITLLVPGAGGRAIVTDVEKTLTDTSAVKFMASTPKDVKEIDGARAALEQLAKDHAIIYMTGIETNFIGQTKDWLRLRGFPRGPVFAWDIAKNALSGETYKTNLLGKLRTDAGGIALAIGGRAEDTIAATKLSLTAYFVGADRDKEVPAEAIWARTWSDVPDLVAKQRTVEDELKDLAGLDATKRGVAQRALAALDQDKIGWLVRFTRASDHALAAAATLAIARIRAREAFIASLDMSSPATTLAALEAAWQQGDETIVARLYRQGAKALEKCGPALATWRGIEIVTRSEPEPGRVVYRLRFLPAAEGAPAERDYALVRSDDGRWWVDTTE